MLPKVASQLIHHTSRAVAVIHNQTGSTFRTVLHSSGPSSTTNLGGRSGSGSSNQGWGGTAEPGGAKTHTGSRFNSGFIGSARVVAHADPSATLTDGVDSSDDYDNPSTITSRLGARTRHRLRSTTLAQVVQRAHDGNSPAVLTALKHHIRANHASAALSLPSQPSDSIIVDTKIIHPSSDSHGPAAGSVQEHASEPSRPSSPTSHLLESLADARSRKDAAAVRAITASLRTDRSLRVNAYNYVLEALRHIRQPGESLLPILEVYNEMLERSVLPNIYTYTTLILAFTDRDLEVATGIEDLERRLAKRKAFGQTDRPDFEVDEKRLSRLRSENNLGSALKLFQTASFHPSAPIHPQVYSALLRSCAFHGNVDAAIHVYAHCENRSSFRPNAQIFAHLIDVHATVQDVQGAEEIFKEFRRASAENKLSWVSPKDTDTNYSTAQAAQVGVWNCMIDAYFRCGHGDKALGLLEDMLDSPAGTDFTPKDVPLPSSATYTAIIQGFCRAGDTDAALAWFRRLLADGKNVKHMYAPSAALQKPSRAAWSVIIEHLITQEGRIADLNELWTTAMRENPAAIRMHHHALVLQANLRYLEQNPDMDSGEADKILRLIYPDILAHRLLNDWIRTEIGDPIRLADSLVRLRFRFCGLRSTLTFAQTAIASTLIFDSDRPKDIERLVGAILDTLGSLQPGEWSFEEQLMLARVAAYGKQIIQPAPFVESFMRAKDEGSLPDIEWAQAELLLQAALQTARSDTGSYTRSPYVDSVLEFLAARSIRYDLFQDDVREELYEYIKNLDASRAEPFASLDSPESQDTTVQTPQAPSTALIDPVHSQYVDEYRMSRGPPTLGYERLQLGAQLGVYPTPEVIARLINALGRSGDIPKLKDVYNHAQTVLNSMAGDRVQQSAAWFSIEDSMIIGLAHGSDVQGAHIHRMRILEQGGTPSADAYGALVQHVTSTTDDSANAMALFQEAISRQVRPNLYLYNTVISKLAKARKADLSLQLFQELKARGIRPSSVTYGSIIAACCRVGDVESAETLFNEMSSQPSFKPRIPPYNTMMQFYTHTIRDRERVLHYYNELLRAGIAPSAHTYKLLLDAYGTIEPLDFDAMQATFNALAGDTKVPVLGTHWAALINAWGCSGRNLEKALEVFHSIETHPRSSGSALPDAICFEALFNVLITLGRTDLIAEYRQQLATRGIHMTAYVANLLIRGYAAAGNMEEARALFESLTDPPEGMAAPNNHSSPEPSPVAASPNDPVYREPSTWEAMVQAELNHGEHDKAAQLLSRAEARRFPEAVMNRISGIRLSESV